MTAHARIAAMIDALRPGPVLEAHADTLDILDALNDRIGSLERAARADRLQARPFKSFAGLKPKTRCRWSRRNHFWSTPDSNGIQECQWCFAVRVAKPKRTHDADGDVIQGNATLNESRQPGRKRK